MLRHITIACVLTLVWLSVVVALELRDAEAKISTLQAQLDMSVATNVNCDRGLVTCLGWQSRVRWAIESSCAPKFGRSVP